MRLHTSFNDFLIRGLNESSGDAYDEAQELLSWLDGFDKSVIDKLLHLHHPLGNELKTLYDEVADFDIDDSAVSSDSVYVEIGEAISDGYQSSPASAKVGWRLDKDDAELRDFEVFYGVSDDIREHFSLPMHQSDFEEQVTDFMDQMYEDESDVNADIGSSVSAGVLSGEVTVDFEQDVAVTLEPTEDEGDFTEEEWAEVVSAGKEDLYRPYPATADIHATGVVRWSVDVEMTPVYDENMLQEFVESAKALRQLVEENEELFDHLDTMVNDDLLTSAARIMSSI